MTNFVSVWRSWFRGHFTGSDSVSELYKPCPEGCGSCTVCELHSEDCPLFVSQDRVNDLVLDGSKPPKTHTISAKGSKGDYRE